MSNPIKSLLPTPLSMELISDFNALAQLPLPLFKLFINSALTPKPSHLNFKDQQLLTTLLKRQSISPQLISPSIHSLLIIENIAHKVLKLMKTSQPNQMQSNLQNCLKYITTVLSQNILIHQTQLNFLISKFTSFVHSSLNPKTESISTKFGIVQWSLYNLKKTNLTSTVNISKINTQEDQTSSNNNLRQINKMYVKLSFDDNFSTSQIQKLIQTTFKPHNQGTTQSKLQTNNHTNHNQQYKKEKSKTITMSLIDFRIFMEELQKVKNLNS